MARKRDNDNESGSPEPAGAARRREGASRAPSRVRPGPSAKEQKAGAYTKAVKTGRGRKFIQEVVAEMKKVTWPTRPELLQATLVVLIAVAIMAAFLGLADQGSEWLTDRIFPSN